MGSSTSKPARSSANAVARRQYPKKPSLSPPKSSPATAAPEGTASLGGFPNKQPSPLRSEGKQPVSQSICPSIHHKWSS